METLTITFHGSAYTHMDALSHMYYKGRTYNGSPKERVVSRPAPRRCTITAFKRGFVGRGVLMDIPRLKGVPYLEPRTAITAADLDAWEKQAGMKVGSGDIVFFRTGRWTRRAKVGAWDIGAESAGLHPGVARWLKSRDVAIVGWDGHGEVMPSLVKGVDFPMHQLLLIAMGTPIFDNCDLEAVAEAAGSRKRWTFLLTASPLAVPHGTGSPLNPIAVFYSCSEIRAYRPSAACLLIEHLADLPGQAVRRERLLQEGDAGVADAVPDHRVVGVAAHEQHLHSGRSGRSARPAPARSCAA